RRQTWRGELRLEPVPRRQRGPCPGQEEAGLEPVTADKRSTIDPARGVFEGDEAAVAAHDPRRERGEAGKGNVGCEPQADAALDGGQRPPDTGRQFGLAARKKETLGGEGHRRNGGGRGF